jgi:hypothetical protein
LKHEGAVTSGLPSAAERPVDLDEGGKLAQLGLREPELRVEEARGTEDPFI